MTAGAAEPRERFVRLAAAVRQRRKQLAQIVPSIGSWRFSTLRQQRGDTTGRGAG